MDDHLLADARRMYEGNAWHGPSLLDALRNVTATQAAARPVRDVHTIYELTHHVAGWIGEVTSRLQGNTPGIPSDGDFPAAGTIVDEAAWSDVRGRLERNHAEFMETLAGFDASRLDDLVDPKNRKDPNGPGTFRALISGLTQHNAYHAGQISLLRKAVSASS
jgi:uncharacterized damage-inducible protein DinB